MWNKFYNDFEKPGQLFVNKSDEIFNSQKMRIYNALMNSTSSEVNNFKSVLKKIING